MKLLPLFASISFLISCASYKKSTEPRTLIYKVKMDILDNRDQNAVQFFNGLNNSTVAYTFHKSGNFRMDYSNNGEYHLNYLIFDISKGKNYLKIKSIDTLYLINTLEGEYIQDSIRYTETDSSLVVTTFLRDTVDFNPLMEEYHFIKDSLPIIGRRYNKLKNTMYDKVAKRANCLPIKIVTKTNEFRQTQNLVEVNCIENPSKKLFAPPSGLPQKKI